MNAMFKPALALIDFMLESTPRSTQLTRSLGERSYIQARIALARACQMRYFRQRSAPRRPTRVYGVFTCDKLPLLFTPVKN